MDKEKNIKEDIINIIREHEYSINSITMTNISFEIVVYTMYRI